MLGSHNALLGVGRLNAFRLNFLDRAIRLRRMAIVQVSIDYQPVRVRVRSLTIRDVINDAPNTCTCTLMTEPTVGGRLRVYSGMDPQLLLFSGQIQKATRSYVGRPTVHAWDVEAIDDTSRSDWLRPFGDFTGARRSVAGDMAKWLVYNYTPGPMSSLVEANLPIVAAYFDGTMRVNEAIRELAKLVGGYFYWEDQVLHFFVTPEAGATPDAITGATGGWLLEDPHIGVATDDSQIRTRVYGKGHAEATLTDIDANESRVPIADAVMFNAGGGTAIAGAQRLTYTAAVIGGTGALVGPGVTPSAPPLVAAVAGSGVTGGAHNYAMTWVTAAGETLPSPVAAITVSTSAPTPVLDSFVGQGGSTPNPPPAPPYYGDPPGTVQHLRIYIAEKFYNGSSNYPDPGLVSNLSAELVATSGNNLSRILFTVTPDMRGRFIGIVMNTGGGWHLTSPGYGYTGWGVPFAVDEPLAQNGWIISSTTYDGVPVPGYGLPSGTMVYAQVQLSGIAVGPSGTIARKLYRTQAGSTALKLLATINDNTTTTYLDASADASLGAAPPGVDTSGLQMAAGQIPVGATAFPVSSTAWANAAGGWAIVGNGDVIVRYAGVSGNQLTGIPASGNGSIVAPINYNSTITGAPMLTGCTWTAIVGGYPVAAVPAGTDVAIWVQRDDTDAQSALAARWGTGIVEHVIVDGRRGEVSLAALCVADLLMYSLPILTVTYTTLDPKTKSGRPVRVTLPDLGIDQTVVIQDVTIDHFDNVTPPRFTVVAGTLNITLEAILRRLVGTVEAF